ncbi:MAG TPA: tetratricopeptide repeat protein [Candidatus Paceibacterota bacterium]|nr:tetratricopeptide repeat protein [Candidatus Paceibacterota bacterium]
MQFLKAEPREGSRSVVLEEAELTSSARSSKKNIYNLVVQVLLITGAFLTPLFFLPAGTSILELNKQILLVVLAGVSLVVWLLGVVVTGKISVRSNVVDRGIAGLLLATVVVTVFSLSQHKSLFGASASLSESLVTILALTIFYFLAVNIFDDGGRVLRIVLTVSLIAALTFGLLQIFTVYLLKLPFTHSRAFNTVGSLNVLGLIAAVGLPLFIKSKILIRNNLYLDVSKLGIVLALLVLTILNWWVLWVITIAGMVVMIALDSLAMAGKKLFNASKFILPMAIIVFGVFLLIINFNLRIVKGQLPIEVAPSFSLSTDIIKSVLNERLITGYGPENFSIAFDKFGARKLANTTLSSLKFYDSTSQIQNFIIHGGLVMVLALLFFFWTVGQSMYKIWHDRENKASPFLSGILSLTAAILVAMFLYPFNITLMFLLYVAMALLVLAFWGHNKHVWEIEEKPMISLASSLGFIAGLILVLAGSYFVTAQYLSDVTFAKASSEPNTDKAVAMYVQAINWNNKDDRYYRSSSQAALGLLTNEINKGNRNDPQRPSRIQNFIASSIDLAKRGTVTEPLEPNNWINLGSVYQSLIGLVDGIDRLAEDSYLKAAQLRPGDSSIYNQIGSMYLARSDLMRQLARQAGANGGRFIGESVASLDKAEKYFKQAINISNNYGLAIYNLGAVYDRQGKVNDAISQLERIIPYNANQPNLLFELGLLYYRAGRKDDALTALERAVELSSNFANARWYLGLIYEERGDLQSAIAQMQKILETNKDNSTVLQKIDDLKKGLTKIPPQKVTDQKPLE